MLVTNLEGRQINWRLNGKVCVIYFDIVKNKIEWNFFNNLEYCQDKRKRMTKIQEHRKQTADLR